MDPFEPPAEVAWTEAGRMYHLRRPAGRTLCGKAVSYLTGRERIQPGDEPCHECFRVQ